MAESKPLTHQLVRAIATTGHVDPYTVQAVLLGLATSRGKYVLVETAARAHGVAVPPWVPAHYPGAKPPPGG